MLFERPVKVGDSVQIDEHLGELKQIGLRASVLRKVDGSDVILPNSMLISGEVINWTMSDKRRRIDIPVGVAYGTDAKMVMDLLTGVATNEPDIIDEPAPVTLFKGFGDNSIDFELRGWTEDTERWVGLRSKLVTAVYAALNEANVEIPFPQRDVHLRSVDDDAAKGLKGGKRS
jgi:potassium efflux system protein